MATTTATPTPAPKVNRLGLPILDYRGGKTNALQALVGQVMKQTRGQAKADIVQSLLRKKLDEPQA